MPVQIVTQPTEEPVSLVDAKLHLRVDMTEDDTLVSGLISASRQYAEMVTRRALCTQTWLLALDQFPAPGMNISSANWYGPQWGTSPGPLSVARVDGKTGFEIYLPFPPLQSVTTVKYYDATTQLLTTLAADQYIVDTISEPARITPAYGVQWPATLNIINAVQVTFVCGYGRASAVPEGIKNWMKVRMTSLYEHRAEIEVIQRSQLVEMPYVDSLLSPFRVVTY